MAHNPLPGTLNKCTFITGVPGVGFNTVGSILKSTMTDSFGFRSDHMKPQEWYVSIPVLLYRITDPESSEIYFHGYGQNFSSIISLPWRNIIVLKISHNDLLTRVSTYRSENNIRDGFTSAQITDTLFHLQDEILESVKKTNNKVHIVDASKSPQEIASIISKL